MDPIRALTHGVLPPAGNRIALTSGDISILGPLFPGKVLHWVDSGTSALALALLDIQARFPEHSSPEVIIPAYCCPDLVSAALHAGFTPVLADLAPDSCHFNLKELSRSVTDRTLAVIAINFLGLPPPLAAIRAVLKRQKQVALIADCAQWFPEEEKPVAIDADYLTFSFGRGKAVNLLGGGLVVAPGAVTPNYLTAPPSWLQAWTYAAKCATYNLLLHPLLYQLLDRNPLLNLGKTRYHALETLASMPPWQQAKLKGNLESYWNHKRSAERAYRETLDCVNDLAPLLRQSSHKLLRYPLLVRDQARRDRLLEELKDAGLGATSLYGDVLPQLADVPYQSLRVDRTEKARDFAQRLITLPVHEGVRSYHQTENINRVLKVLT